MSARVLVVSLRDRLDKKVFGLIAKEGEVKEVTREELRQQPIPAADVVLLNCGPESMEVGQEMLSRLKSKDEGLPVIFLTKLTGVDHAVEIMKSGAFDYFQIPPNLEKLKLAFERALRTSEMHRRMSLLESQVGWEDRLDDIVGISPQMQEIFQMVKTVARSNATVLIIGESGTGKELIAKAIHRHSDRAQNKFIDINCGAIPKELLENELFGHERGAFTGADRQYIGSCERAHGGTLFLDEVSEMDPSLQVKLLRVLQERSISRIGGTEKINIDIRVIAATNKDLRVEVDKGAFREDLYYRLNVVPIHLPPLRQRRADIPPLAQYFLDKYSKENEKRFRGFTPEAMESLVQYDWPGNVRELENNIERIVVLHEDSRVKPSFLPRFIVNTEKKAELESSEWDQGFQKILPLKTVEQYAIESAIKRCMGDVLTAAKKLGIGQATLYRKIKKYGIKAA
ncbi:MAG TPA: sigma-54 dependent transcriptional regulator [bacterium]|nr:sigma-54 dependent transcriptional regulator [bacterium]